jgi:hypothetical protein
MTSLVIFFSMGRYGSEIFRACRLVVDTGLHYFKLVRYLIYFDTYINVDTMFFTVMQWYCVYILTPSIPQQ